MEKTKKELEKEIEIFQQIRAWARGDDLDGEFCEMLDELLDDGLVHFFEEIVADFPSVELTIRWTCPICEKENKYNESYFDDNWCNKCKECGCTCRIAQPDF